VSDAFFRPVADVNGFNEITVEKWNCKQRNYFHAVKKYIGQLTGLQFRQNIMKAKGDWSLGGLLESICLHFVQIRGYKIVCTLHHAFCGPLTSFSSLKVLHNFKVLFIWKMFINFSHFVILRSSMIDNVSTGILQHYAESKF